MFNNDGIKVKLFSRTHNILNNEHPQKIHQLSLSNGINTIYGTFYDTFYGKKIYKDKNFFYSLLLFKTVT